tara:strand:+ start:12555 stop:13271 length:717 start_codon:yes stop_codon:yes gene_type:complete
MNAIKIWCIEYKLLLKTGLVICFFFILCCALFVLGHQARSHQHGYAVEIETPDQSLVSAYDIKQFIYKTHQQPFLNLDLARIRNEVSQMPWVKSVEIHRQWPYTLFIQIASYQPLARFNDDAWLDEHGALFTAPMQPRLASLPQLMGTPKDSQRIMNFYHTASSILSKENLNIKKIYLSVRNAWQIELKNGLQLILGKEARVKRLKRFAMSYAQLKPNIQVHDFIDLRYDSGIAVRHQ